MEYGIQMFSLRDIARDDMEKALKIASEIGYHGVEFAQFGNCSAAQIKGWLEKYHLAPWSSHIMLEDLQNDFAKTVDFHREIGCYNLTICCVIRDTKSDVEAAIKGINEMIPRLAEEGMTLHFHNHYWDHNPNRDNVINFQELVTRTNVNLELDTYWLCVGGLDPVTIMDKMKDRVHFIHLKDGDGGFNGRSLGQGATPIKKVHKKAEELGYRMIVESEGCNPTGPEEVKRCYDYLMSISK